jgi:hypothetical protein
MRSRVNKAIVVLALGLVAATAVFAAERETTHASRVPMPAVPAASGGQCVEDPAFMRRNHMQLLVHERDATMREGKRTDTRGLQDCVECHAHPKTQRVTGEEGFCQACHSYAAVKIDCFSCHADQPKKAPVAPALSDRSGSHLTTVAPAALAGRQEASP